MADDYYKEIITSKTKIVRVIRERLGLAKRKGEKVVYLEFIDKMESDGFDRINVIAMMDVLSEECVILFPTVKYVELSGGN